MSFFSTSLANVENTPVKIIPIKKLSFDPSIQEHEIIEETPVKEDEMLQSDIMAREIQRLSLRLRSSTPCKILINDFRKIFYLFI